MRAGVPSGAGRDIPEVALLPGDGVEHGGHHEEPAETQAVDPGGNGLPVIVGQEVEVGAAEDAGEDPELWEGTAAGASHAGTGPASCFPPDQTVPLDQTAATRWPRGTRRQPGPLKNGVHEHGPH